MKATLLEPIIYKGRTVAAIGETITILSTFHIDVYIIQAANGELHSIRKDKLNLVDTE